MPPSVYAADVTIDDSISLLMKRLVDWSEFPKYALERRIDIFVTPFLEGFVGRKLGGTARLIAPEFPLPAALRDEFPQDGHPADALTVNVDYLLSLDRPAPGSGTWVFLELKTDALSFKEPQLKLYRRARARTMRILVEDVRRVGKETKARHRPKYAKLLSKLDCNLDAEIEIVYLSPMLRRGFPSDSPGEYFWTLSEFAAQSEEQIDPEHRALWSHVQELLRHINPASHPT